MSEKFRDLQIDNTPKISHKSINRQVPDNGEHIILDDSGNIKERNFYVKGKKNGESRVYKNGLLIQRKTYKDDVLEGFVEIYSNGNLQMLTKYSGNFPNGIGYFFHNTGIINAIAYYKNGLLDGLFLVFNEQGFIIKRQFYKDNLLNGPTVTYHENGEICETGNYKDNLQEGQWTTKDPTGKLRQTAIFQGGICTAKKTEK